MTSYSRGFRSLTRRYGCFQTRFPLVGLLFIYCNYFPFFTNGPSNVLEDSYQTDMTFQLTAEALLAGAETFTVFCV